MANILYLYAVLLEYALKSFYSNLISKVGDRNWEIVENRGAKLLSRDKD